MHNHLSHGVSTALSNRRVLPLIDSNAPQHMARLASGLRSAGLPVAEVTLRRPHSLHALRELASSPDLVVGAGTVMTERQVGEAVAAGAQFLVSPGFSPTVQREAARQSVPLIPGVSTATELMTALDAGITTVKFFPASSSGGPARIRALAAVAPSVTWVPTGGIDAASAADYLAIPTVLAVGGSWMAPASLIDDGRFDEIEPLLRAASALVS